MTQISTCGLQLRLTFLINLRALMYSPWIIRAALTKSPSHLLTATRSATSTIPFFIPVQKCILVNVQWHNLKGLWELHVKQRAKQLVKLSLLKNNLRHYLFKFNKHSLPYITRINLRKWVRFSCIQQYTKAVVCILHFWEKAT